MHCRIKPISHIEGQVGKKKIVQNKNKKKKNPAFAQNTGYNKEWVQAHKQQSQAVTHGWHSEDTMSRLALEPTIGCLT